MYVGLAGFGIDDGPATFCSLSTSMAASVIVCGVKGVLASFVTMAVDVVVVVDDNDERSVQASVCGAPHALFTAPAPGSRVPAGTYVRDSVWRAESSCCSVWPSCRWRALGKRVGGAETARGSRPPTYRVGPHTTPTHPRTTVLSLIASYPFHL